MKFNLKKTLSTVIIFLLIGLMLLGTLQPFLQPNTNTAVNNQQTSEQLQEDKAYYSAQDVASYLYYYGKLPKNYLTKAQAEDLGWIASEGNLWDVTDQGVIGGDRFENREGHLPSGQYYEADVEYYGGFRNQHRLVYTEGGNVIYYTGDHYNTFTKVTP